MATAGATEVRRGSRERAPRPTPRGLESLTDLAFPAAAAVLGGAAVACGAVLAMRRLLGGFGPAPAGTAWFVTAAGIALVALADLPARHGAGIVAPLVARVGLLLGVAAVTLPPHAGDWASIAAVMLAAGVAVMPPPTARRPRPRRRARAVEPPTRRVSTPPAAAPTSARREDRVPGRLLQRLERYETGSGGDCLRGRVHLAIAAGSRQAHAHVGFCPAFGETPSVRVTTEYDGVDAIVSAAEVLPWGVRVECRLGEPAEEPLEIPVDVLAQASR